MQTEHDNYPAIVSAKGIRFDAYTGTGTYHMQVDERVGREETILQIEKFLAQEVYGHSTGIYLQERLWEDARNYVIPVRVNFRTVLSNH